MDLWAVVSQDWAVVPEVPLFQEARYWASIRERRWTKAVAVGETRLISPPRAVRAMLPLALHARDLGQEGLDARRGDRAVEEVRAGRVRLAAQRALGERPGVEPGRWHLASVEKEAQPA